MTVRVYRKITNTCFIVAAASIVLLGRLPGVQWPLLGVAVVAGLFALVLHLYAQVRPLATAASVETLAVEASRGNAVGDQAQEEDIVLKEQEDALSRDEEDEDFLVISEPETASSFYKPLTRFPVHGLQTGDIVYANPLAGVYGVRAGFGKARIFASHGGFAVSSGAIVNACEGTSFSTPHYTVKDAVRIAKELTLVKRDFEVTLRPDGCITIRPVKSLPAEELGLEEQQDAPFPHLRGEYVH